MMRSNNPEQQPNKQYVEVVRDERDYDREAFDRVAYAKRLLRVLSPAGLRVAICPGTEKLSVESGRDWFRGRGRWALLSVPPDASRAHIAVTVARLAGREADPYVLDVLMRTRTP